LIPECGGNYANIADIENDVRVEEVDLREQEPLPPLLEGREFVLILAGHTSHIDSMSAPQTDPQLT
jgi:UDP-glucose 4-epimerase